MLDMVCEIVLQERSDEVGQSNTGDLPVLVRPTHGDVSLHSDGQGHVNARTEGDCGHRVQDVNVELGEDLKIKLKVKSKIHFETSSRLRKISLKVSLKSFPQTGMWNWRTRRPLW